MEASLPRPGAATVHSRNAGSQRRPGGDPALDEALYRWEHPPPGQPGGGYSIEAAMLKASGGALAVVLLVGGCAAASRKPVDVEMPAADKHFIVSNGAGAKT